MGLVVRLKDGISGMDGTQASFDTTVDSSESRVWKLWTGLPSGSVLVAALAKALIDKNLLVDHNPIISQK